jgi:hypothetical protein
MHTGESNSRLPFFVLCAGLVAVFVLFGVRAKYSPNVYYALAAIQLIVVCLSAWKAGAWAIRAETVERRRLAVAGALLVASWALFSFLPGIGPPGDQTRTENALRYLILLISSIGIAVGLIVLKEALSEAGERFYSTLGFAAIVLATPLYLIWAIIAVGIFRGPMLVTSAVVPPEIALMADVTGILLFFGGALTYVATAAFAASLGKTQWLGRILTRVCVTASLLALLFLVVRGMQFPVRAEALSHWSTIPGFVVGIPAIPWVIPVLFGVFLLRRAGNDQR